MLIDAEWQTRIKPNPTPVLQVYSHFCSVSSAVSSPTMIIKIFTFFFAYPFLLKRGIRRPNTLRQYRQPAA